VYKEEKKKKKRMRRKKKGWGLLVLNMFSGSRKINSD
jgi:hypothetical protein